MRTPEGVTKDAIKAVLKEYGDELYAFWPVQTGYGVRTVDCIICFSGRFIAVEAKRMGMRARRFQERTLDQILKAGGEAICVDSIHELKGLLARVARSST